MRVLPAYPKALSLAIVAMWPNLTGRAHCVAMSATDAIFCLV